MKLTKSQLKQIIKEELEEAYGGALGPFPERYGTQPQPDSQERAMHVLEKHHGAQAAEVKALVELAAEYGRDGKDPMDAVISFYHGVNP